MCTRRKAYAHVLLSLALGGPIVLLVLRIVRFSDAVTSHNTPAILNVENLAEGSQHLKVDSGGGKQHQKRDNIAARHFLYALGTHGTQGETQWPRRSRWSIPARAGNTFRTFNAVDGSNREALAVEVDTSLPAGRAVRVLDRIAEERGVTRRS